MGVRTKTLITVILVGAVIGIVTLQTSNKSLFKGQIFKEPTKKTETSEAESASKLPDLKAELVISAPEKPDGDLTANVTITNLGPGLVEGKKPFKYTVYLNNIEIFSNTDSYTVMNADDSFSFSYPISRAIYNYPNEGKAKVVVDTDNAIDEENEDNNSSEVQYFLK